MKQAPLFHRQFFVQRGTASANLEAALGAEYIRVHGSPSNPGKALDGQRVRLMRGGLLDVVSDPRGGIGLGRISYEPGLRAGLKRSEESFTYRFEVPSEAPHGTVYQVAVWGSAEHPTFRFTIEVQG